MRSGLVRVDLGRCAAGWVLLALGLTPVGAAAQGTKQWTVGRFDEMERGTAEHVAIRSDGLLEAGPVTSLVGQTTASFVWSVAGDEKGGVVAGVGGASAGMAAVVRLAPRGKVETGQTIWKGTELGVQAVRVGADGTVFAATSPNGKVYRMGADGGGAKVIFDPATTAAKPKYVWDLALGRGGEVYVATGAPAAVYRVPAEGGKAEVLFQTADQHIRCLLMGADGTLWAGSDGSGVIYRISTTAKGAMPFAAYAAPKREITALAMDADGNVYAAGVGTKPAAGAVGALPPLQVTGEAGVTVTFLQPGSTAAVGSSALVPEGSDLYRIATDGTPERMLTLKDDVVYALAMREGRLVAATGNRGRIYEIALDGSGRYTDMARLDAAQATAMVATGSGVLVGTSNSGKIFRVGDDAAAAGTYTSEVFDAGQIAQWGRAAVETVGSAAEISVRSGNVPNPVMGWSAWTPVGAEGRAAGLPAGRFAQWKAELRGTEEVRSVGWNYLPRNVAPVVDEVVVATGARVSSTAVANVTPTVQVVFPAAAGVAQAISYVQDTNATPLTAQKDRTGVTVRWAAHDENGDDLMFAVWARGEGEANWRLLKDRISERFLSFDSSLLPDGRYTVKVVASDGPVHGEGAALTGWKASGEFVVDTTPPVPGVLTAQMEGGGGAGQWIHATVEATDAVSEIGHAEYAVDAGAWQYVEPVGGLSDARMERYDFVAAVGPRGGADVAGGAAAVMDPAEHVIAVRIYDRAENMVTVKAVVR